MGLQEVRNLGTRVVGKIRRGLHAFVLHECGRCSALDFQRCSITDLKPEAMSLINRIINASFDIENRKSSHLCRNAVRYRSDDSRTHFSHHVPSQF